MRLRQHTTLKLRSDVFLKIPPIFVKQTPIFEKNKLPFSKKHTPISEKKKTNSVSLLFCTKMAYQKTETRIWRMWKELKFLSLCVQWWFKNTFPVPSFDWWTADQKINEGWAELFFCNSPVTDYTGSNIGSFSLASRHLAIPPHSECLSPSSVVTVAILYVISVFHPTFRVVNFKTIPHLVRQNERIP